MTEPGDEPGSLPSPKTSETSSGDIGAYISAIGQRVRGARARRGMTRKDLSKHSEISQRYLSQVESGEANISVILLSRIGKALNLGIHELLPPSPHRDNNSTGQLERLLHRLSPAQLDEAGQILLRHFGMGPAEKRGVALIGLRGGGKSTLGKLLASAYDIPFVHLGHVIESLAGVELSEIFARGGQETYRGLEKRAVEQVLQTHERVVMETGGSLVSEQDTFDLVLRSYFTVWVQAAPAEHMERVLQQGDMRPMRGNREAMADLKLILEERAAQYELAHYKLNTTGRNIDDCLEELVHESRSWCKDVNES
jgi:XRE family aerobic/anaerobic benzoate catabolism transcriptional regulator